MKVISTLAVLMMLACACSRQETQKTVAHRLREADRLIVLNANDGATVTIKDEQLKKIVQALAAAEKVSNGEMILASPGYTLVFFKSRIHLSTVPTGAEIVFYIDKTAYQDKSGTLLAVMKRFWETHPDSR